MSVEIRWLICGSGVIGTIPSLNNRWPGGVEVSSRSYWWCLLPTTSMSHSSSTFSSTPPSALTWLFPLWPLLLELWPLLKPSIQKESHIRNVSLVSRSLEYLKGSVYSCGGIVCFIPEVFEQQL